MEVRCGNHGDCDRNGRRRHRRFRGSRRGPGGAAPRSGRALRVERARARSGGGLPQDPHRRCPPRRVHQRRRVQQRRLRGHRPQRRGHRRRRPRGARRGGGGLRGRPRGGRRARHPRLRRPDQRGAGSRVEGPDAVAVRGRPGGAGRRADRRDRHPDRHPLPAVWIGRRRSAHLQQDERVLRRSRPVGRVRPRRGPVAQALRHRLQPRLEAGLGSDAGHAIGGGRWSTS